MEMLSRSELNTLYLLSSSNSHKGPLSAPNKRQQESSSSIGGLFSSFMGSSDSSSGSESSTKEDCPTPKNFPGSIPLQAKEYRNWAENIQMDNMWVAIPRTYKDILILANWAYLNDFMLRPKGYSNSWAPLTVTKSSSCLNTVLVDTTQFLVQMKMLSSKGSFRAVQVQTGATIESLQIFLEDHKCALWGAPVMGELTVGGVLAVSGHGSGAGVMGEYGGGNGYSAIPSGYSSGSLSNLILSFKAVVWDPEKDSYVIKKFSRTERDSRVFLAHMGRAFLTQVTLLVGPSYKLRCQTWSHLTTQKLLLAGHTSDDDDKSPQNDDDRHTPGEDDDEDDNYQEINIPEDGEEENETFASLVEKYHSIDLSVFPYTDQTLVLACSNRTKHCPAKVAATPYPFSYLENVPRSVSTLLSQFLSGRHYLAPMMSRLNHQFNSVGLRLSNNEDLCGQSKNLQLRYNAKNSITHSYSSGYAIITSRDHLQKVTADVYRFYRDLVEKYSASWKYPQNEPIQFSVTGLDDPRHLPPFGRFESPALSILSPVRKKKGKRWDIALFVGINVYPGTRYFDKFMREIESFLFLNYDGEGEGLVRPEWSKAWAFTDDGAWDNHILLRKVIPKAFGSDWEWAVRKLNHYDPYHIFSNEFLNYFLQASTQNGGRNSNVTANNQVNNKRNRLSMLMNWQAVSSKARQENSESAAVNETTSS